MLTKLQQKFIGKFDKEIYFIKYIIWEVCPLRCAYCFVNKKR